MEAGSILGVGCGIPWKLKHPLPLPLSSFRCFSARASSNSLRTKIKPKRDWVADWIQNNDENLRGLPISVGGASLLAVLVNRAVSGIAPVADASRSLVIVYDCHCILQIGVAAKSVDNEALCVDAAKLMQGSLYQAVIKSASQSYLANLSLYPGRSQLPFLPSKTQAVILQPLGDKGIAIIGGDTIRGFTSSDQAWITLIGEKLDATLAKYVMNDQLVVQDGRRK